jgi:predicted PurR-regulated permease PerM
VGGAVQRVLLPVVAALVALWLAGRLWSLLWALVWPFLAGGLLALAVERPIRSLCRRGWPRPLAALTCLAAGMAAGLGVGAWIVAGIWREVARLARRLPATDALLASVSRALAPGGTLAWLPAGVRALLSREVLRVQGGAAPLLQHVLAVAQRLALATPDALFGAFVALATAYFGASHRAELAEWLEGASSRGTAARVAALVRVARDSVWGLVRAQLLLSLITFAISLAGLWLIGAPYVLLASLAAGLLDLLPVVGPGLVYGPWILGAVLGHMPGAAVGLAAVFACVGLARWLSTPHLLGRGVGLHPFTALAAMYLGARLSGVSGLVLGPLAAALVQAVWRPGPRAPGPAGSVPPRS